MATRTSARAVAHRANAISVTEQAEQVPEEVRKVIVVKALNEIFQEADKIPQEADKSGLSRYQPPPEYVPTPEMVEKVGHRLSEVRMLLEGLHSHLYNLMEAPDIELSLAVALSVARESAQACNAATVALLGSTWEDETFNDPLETAPNG